MFELVFQSALCARKFRRALKKERTALSAVVLSLNKQFHPNSFLNINSEVFRRLKTTIAFIVKAFSNFRVGLGLGTINSAYLKIDRSNGPEFFITREFLPKLLLKINIEINFWGDIIAFFLNQLLHS